MTEIGSTCASIQMQTSTLLVGRGPRNHDQSACEVNDHSFSFGTGMMRLAQGSMHLQIALAHTQEIVDFSLIC